MKLLNVAAYGINFGNTRNGAKLRSHHPILNFAQISRGPFLALSTGRRRFGLDGVHENLAQAGGDGTHGRLESCRQFSSGLLKTFVDELACQVDVGAVLEDRGHL